MERHLRSAFIVLALVIVQSAFMPYVSIGGFLPDLLLIWVAYTAIRRGQVEGMIAGFLVGLLQDTVATQLFGLAALSKTIAGFLGGYFHNENKTDQILGSYQFLMIVGMCSLVHNMIFFLIFLQGTDGALVWTLLQYSTATTAYTGAISALPMFVFARKVAT
ncbi:MAG TPA: rod shape-determining protein MreD [Bacteroidota bacterium]